MQVPNIAIHFLYIFITVLCTVTATLYLSRAISRSEPICKAVSVLTVAMLVYAIIEMFLASYYFALVSARTLHLIIVASDIAFFVIVVSWVEMLLLLSGNPYMIKPNGIVVYTIIYGFTVEAMAVFVKLVTDEKYISSLNIAILAVNIVFDATILVISIVFLKYALFGMREEKHRGWLAGLSFALAAYMLYIIYWDICSRTIQRGNISKYQDFDPVFIFYILVCIAVIWLIAKKSDSPLGFDISKTIGVGEAGAADWEHISRQYKLTMREVEVSQLVCRGISNPDIAGRLFISESTVKHHLSNIYRKTGVKSRYELINIVKLKN